MTTSPPGKGAGLREVALEAGVSAATVSNTLNRPEMVAPGTRIRVRDAMERLEFVPHLGAASLKKGRSRLIGLVVPDITNSFYAEIARGVLAAADRFRYAVVLCNSQDEPAREKQQLAMLAEHRAMGVLVVPLSADQRRLDQLRKLGAHLVVIDRAVAEPDGCSVSIDDVHGGQIAVAHLVSRVGNDLALVNGSASIRQCADRRQGAQWALVAAGHSAEDLQEHVVSEMTAAAGEQVGLAMARSHVPKGVFCTNDQLAIGVIRGLAHEGVEVPGSTAVVGYGDLAIAVDAPLPLTTVDQPKYALGQVAVEQLLSEIDLPDEHHRHRATVFQPSLVIRASAP